MQENLLHYCLFVRGDLLELKPDFFEATEIYGMRSDLYMFKALQKYLSDYNIKLDTQNKNVPEESDVIICLNETDYFINYKRSKKNKLLVLLLSEPIVYNAKDWESKRHAAFDKVFTYETDLVAQNNKKYIHLPYPIDFSQRRPFAEFNEELYKSKKHACLVASAFAITKNKESKSLLYDRYRILKWYNQQAPALLDYFSRANPIRNFKFFRGASLLNKFGKTLTDKTAAFLFKTNISKVYRGSIPGEKKLETLSNYKFNFCLENSAATNGYVTEKIFDSFFAHTIPIYQGAPNIDQLIPPNCYICYADFKNLTELNKYLLEMNFDTYSTYLKNAEKFLNSQASEYFSIKNYVEKIYTETQV